MEADCRNKVKTDQRTGHICPYKSGRKGEWRERASYASKACKYVQVNVSRLYERRNDQTERLCLGSKGVGKNVLGKISLQVREKW